MSNAIGGQAFLVECKTATVTVGGSQDAAGSILARDNEGRTALELDGEGATFSAGCKEHGGTIKVLDGEAREAVRLVNGAVFAGTMDNPGRVYVHDGVTGCSCDLVGSTGTLTMRGEAGSARITLNGPNAKVDVGSAGMAGQLNVCDASGLDRITLDAATGDIRLRGADCAEEFDLADGATAEPGTVVVLDDEGRLHPCHAAYDRRVVGVVSGYGDLTLGSSSAGRTPARIGHRSPSAARSTARWTQPLARSESGPADRLAYARPRYGGNRPGPGLRGRRRQGAQAGSGRPQPHTHPRRTPVGPRRTKWLTRVKGWCWPSSWPP